jgi:Zn finger protein HypA/HybF involved in hydrogenase expression
VALIAYFVWLISTGKLKKGDLNVDMKKVAQILDRDINEALNIRDNIDHCPKCGSHNLKLYRKGYNYKVGFWGSIFGVRGAGYAAGIDSNKACCRCMNCGNDWETDYDYRLL